MQITQGQEQTPRVAPSPGPRQGDVIFVELVEIPQVKDKGSWASERGNSLGNIASGEKVDLGTNISLFYLPRAKPDVKLQTRKTAAPRGHRASFPKPRLHRELRAKPMTNAGHCVAFLTHPGCP